MCLPRSLVGLQQALQDVRTGTGRVGDWPCIAGRPGKSRTLWEGRERLWEWQSSSLSRAEDDGRGPPLPGGHVPGVRAE